MISFLNCSFVLSGLDIFTQVILFSNAELLYSNMQMECRGVDSTGVYSEFSAWLLLIHFEALQSPAGPADFLDHSHAISSGCLVLLFLLFEGG